MTLEIHENIKKKLDYFYKIHKIPNLLFHGPSGSGKRTIVNNFIQTIYDNNKEKIKSVIHIDNTCRVQTVTKDYNNVLYNFQ